MGQMKRLRQREFDRRTGRAWATRATLNPPPPEAEAAYDDVTARLMVLRAALARDRFDARASSDVNRDQVHLQRLLGEAIARAFAADAAGSLRPVGAATWAAEGLSLSHERELVLLGLPGEAPRMRAAADTPTFREPS